MRVTTNLNANIRNIFSHIREGSLRRISLSSHHYAKQKAKYKGKRNRSLPIVRGAENMIYVAKADALGE
jgi:hypothetical protein